MAEEDVRAPDEEDDDGPPLSPRARVISTVAFVVVGLALLFVFVRLTSPAIRPEQKAPANHVPGPCAVCHAVSETAKPIEVKK